MPQSDGSEYKLLVRIFAGIAFGCWAAVPVLFLSRVTSDEFATTLWGITGIAIAWLVVKKIKLIEWVLNLNILIYLFFLWMFITHVRDLHDWTFYSVAFVTLTITLTSLVIRLRLKKVG